MLRMTLKRRYLYLPVALYLLATIAFAIFYLTNSHASLLHWFFRLNDCFYRRSNFVQQIFTPETKGKGNLWCMLTLPAVSILLFFLLRAWKRDRRQIFIDLSGITLKRSLPYLLLLIAGMGLWLYANNHFNPGTDEIFSAVHCAELPPFQCLSYYMSPNNHLLFNVVNSVLSPAGVDKVLSGRLLSLLIYLSFICWVYHWLRQEMSQPFLAFITILVLAVQVPVWGFGAQGRGYECCMLASWVSFIALYNYFLKGRRTVHLMLYALGMSVGYMVIPTFLYIGICLLVFAIILQFMHRKIDWRFWKYTAASMVIVLCFYLPMLCFSGIATIAQNKYVTAAATPMPEFLQHFYDTSQYNCNCGFWGAQYQNNWRNYLIFFAPLLLLFRKRWFYYGLFYSLLWGVYIAMVLYMKRDTFSRNLIGHFSISLAMIFLVIYALLQEVSHFIKPFRSKAIYVCIAASACGYYICSFDEAAKFSLYGSDNNRLYTETEASLSIIPPGSSIGLSDADFMYYYIMRKKGCTVSRCHLSNEQYVIFYQEEVLPGSLMAHYMLFDHKGEFNFYKKKPSH